MEKEFKNQHSKSTESTVEISDQEASCGSDWPLDDPKNVAVFTTASVLSGSRPILHVSHDEDDGAWQFHSDNNPNMSEAKLVSLYSVVELDPTLRELADLPFGWEADRPSVDKPWQRRQK